MNDSDTKGEERGLHYQPALDGMRGLGLVAVLTAHMGVFFPQLVGYSSWLALDQFFVLSGFLITTLMMREFGKAGRISLRGFYVRRVGRLYPMIFAAFVIAVVLRLFASNPLIRPSWMGVWSIPGYFSNWAIVLSNDWSVLGGFSQLWSLAIEEQFYLVWPLAVVVLLALGGRRRAIIGVVGAALVAMLVYRRHLWLGWLDHAATHPEDPDLVQRGNEVWNLLYVGTFTRPDGILVGCLLAAFLGFHPRRPGRRTRAVAAVVGMAGFAIDVLLFVTVGGNDRAPFIFNWGLFVFNLGAAATILHLLYNPRALLSRFYAMRPLVWLGQRSYGIYVIHLVVYTSFLDQGWDSIAQVAFANVIVLTVATVSHRYYEMPFRRYLTSRAEHPRGRTQAVEGSP